MRTEFETGGWVDHRPLQDLKAKDKDAVSMAIKMILPVTAEGEIDLSQGIAAGGDMQIRSRNATIARVITAWPFTTDDGTPLPVPEWVDKEIVHEESIAELPLDAINEIEELLAPYMAKLRSRPNRAGGTTSSSNGSSPARARGSRRG